MRDSKVHHFQSVISDIPLPEKFTYPFCYKPHPLCLLATKELQLYLSNRTEWKEELQSGKMFGVLVVKDGQGNIGFLAAFSGNLSHSNQHEYFVPPVYDLLQPDGFFKKEEAQITAINQKIKEYSESEAFAALKNELDQNEAAFAKERNSFKAQMQIAKERREEKRGTELTEEEKEALIKESQFQKAEYKRLEKSWKERLAVLEAQWKEAQLKIENWKHERKMRSAALQLKLFQQFRMLNGLGDVKDLCELFLDTPQGIPPAGAGECAAPKLLQYAFLKTLQPICMAEFWWGDSPKNEVRHHGCFYPACQGKCGPILRFMLKGLDVEENPMVQEEFAEKDLAICYEDEYLLVVNKPAGMLSVPGKEKRLSVYEIIRKRYPNATGPLIVHRLDMATSGLLLIAKSKEIHQELQEQFRLRTVKKKYIAWLDGTVESLSGTISLPLSPDYLNRPCQKVDEINGKQATTDYKVLSRENGRTWIAFYPQTGRTHQLRLHAAHISGLNAPIVGDELYGKPAERLYLHAEEIEFTHPVSKKRIRIEKKL